jgi:outer membrane beta-barrel protein
MFNSTCMATVLVLTLGMSFAQGASSKYQRPDSSASSGTVDPNAPVPAGTAAPANGKKATTSPSSGTQVTTANGEKVDLTDLESRFWTAKDTEFNVVQNRTYTKAHKFSATAIVGTDLSGSYTNDYNIGLAINYYFSERQGVELQGWKTNSNKASFVSTFESVNGASYDYNYTQGFIGVNYNWIPIYAKLSLLEKKILYFDMSINPGLGVTFLQSNSFGTPTFPANAVSQAPITGALDIAQQVFLTSHWAIKLDLDSHFYSETTYKSGTGSGGTAGQNLGSKFTYEGIFMLGVTFFQ